jgi:hypothetical protein
VIHLFGFLERFRKHIGQLVTEPRRYHRVQNDVQFFPLAGVERHDVQVERFVEPLGIVCRLTSWTRKDCCSVCGVIMPTDDGGSTSASSLSSFNIALASGPLVFLAASPLPS